MSCGGNAKDNDSYPSLNRYHSTLNIGKEIKKKMAVLLIKQNLVISCCFAENRKEMYQQIFQRTCIAIVLFKKKNC